MVRRHSRESSHPVVVPAMLTVVVAALVAVIAALAACGRIGPAPSGPPDPPPTDVRRPGAATDGAEDAGAAPVLQELVALGGDTSCTWGSFNQACNLCVPDVPGHFNDLRDHGEVLGFNNGGVELNLAYPSDNHLEGIQRLPASSGRAFVISKRDDRPDGSVAHYVRMESRDPYGMRFRSNRLSRTISQPEDTPPPDMDAVAGSLPLIDGYIHGGGMQALGNVVAIPIEEGPGNGKVVLYDYTNPSSPSRLAALPSSDGEAGTASIAKLSNGHYMVLLGHKDARLLEVFFSTEADIRSPSILWTKVDSWHDFEIGSGEWGAFQSLNLVTDCNDGQLYLVGTRLGGLRWGALYSDFAHLYRVNVDAHMRIEHVASKQFNCSNDGSRQCNFDAAGGAFVGADHKLVLYVTEHADDGPYGSVRLVEFRNRWVTDSCGTSTYYAWADFYDDSDFTDRGFIYDNMDAGRKDWSNFHMIDAFNDKASAVRWCIPRGFRVRLYADSGYRGSYKDLIGNGGFQEVNLNSWGFGDKISSIRWQAF